jgi:hypothetical protein
MLLQLFYRRPPGLWILPASPPVDLFFITSFVLAEFIFVEKERARFAVVGIARSSSHMAFLEPLLPSSLCSVLACKRQTSLVAAALVIDPVIRLLRAADSCRQLPWYLTPSQVPPLDG